MNNVEAIAKTEDNFPRIVKAAATGSLMASLFGWPLIMSLLFLQSGINNGMHFKNIEPLKDWLIMIIPSSFFVMPIGLFLGIPLITGLRDLPRVYMILLSCLIASLLAGAFVFLLSGIQAVEGFWLGIPYGFIYGVVIAWFRGPGRVGRFSIEIPPDISSHPQSK